MKSIKVVASGIVQGVGFRWAVAKQARRYQVTGIVSNQGDGSVYLEIEGSNDNVDAFLDWVQHGPTPFAKVNQVQVSLQSLHYYRTFSIV